VIGLWRGIALVAGLVCAPAICAADKAVTFPTARYLVGDLQQRLAKERGEPLKPAPTETIRAYLSKPAGTGPFAAVVYMHGCAGLSAYTRDNAGAQMTRWGYVTLVVDSFATRGLKETCTTGAADRLADAYGALAYLSMLAFVDALRIALVGQSQGGIAALRVASFHPFEIFAMPGGLKYKAVVAFYPSCSAAADQLAIPALVLIGARDDWTPPVRCDWWMQRRQGKGAPVKLVVFPGAYHAFDKPGLRDGKWSFGHWLKYDAEATARANVEMHDFLAAQLAE
jgi:dienelactone hydrolase